MYAVDESSTESLILRLPNSTRATLPSVFDYRYGAECSLSCSLLVPIMFLVAHIAVVWTQHSLDKMYILSLSWECVSCMVCVLDGCVSYHHMQYLIFFCGVRASSHDTTTGLLPSGLSRMQNTSRNQKVSACAADSTSAAAATPHPLSNDGCTSHTVATM